MYSRKGLTIFKRIIFWKTTAIKSAVTSRGPYGVTFLDEPWQGCFFWETSTLVFFPGEFLAEGPRYRGTFEKPAIPLPGTRLQRIIDPNFK